MPTDSIRASSISPENAGERTDQRTDERDHERDQERSDELPRVRLALMRELEASLQGSRKALLALDLVGIERGTREQVGLTREIEAVLQRGIAQPAKHRAPPAKHRTAPEQESSPSAYTPELEDELRRCQNRVREAARLQAALLARAQRKLRILANMLAGPSLNYGALLGRDGALPTAFASRRRI
jgi:hypothetical protein